MIREQEVSAVKCDHCGGAGWIDPRDAKARNARDGMEKVANNTSPEDKQAVIDAIYRYCSSVPFGTRFQTAQVWPYIPEDVKARINKMVMGPMVKAAERLGYVTNSGDKEACDIEGFHSRASTVWVNNINVVRPDLTVVEDRPAGAEEWD